MNFISKSKGTLGASILMLVPTSMMCMSCAAAAKTNAQKGQQPNVIYIFPDQLRNYSLGFWNQGDNVSHLQGAVSDPTNTPAIDSLASNSVVFSHAISNHPLSSPYRGMLLTGMYPYQNGITTNCKRGRSEQLISEATCLTDVYSEAGYDVAYFGKCHWQENEDLFDEEGNYKGTLTEPGGHNVNEFDTYVPGGIDRHHIDYFYQLLSDQHMNPITYSNDPTNVNGKKDGEAYRPHRFSTKLESESIVRFLRNTHGQRQVNKPFFITWAINPPHNPWTPASTDMEFYPQYVENGQPNFDKLLTRPNADAVAGKHAPYYYANVSAVDHYIGDVLNELRKQGLMENTIVVFSSDHGEMLGSHHLEGKNYPFIECYNIPWMIQWKGHLNHHIEDMVMSAPDIMPTLLGLSGLKDKIPEEVMGTDYAELLTNPTSKSVARPTNAIYYGGHQRGVYNKQYMLVVVEKKGKFAEAYVYDNVNDPFQMKKLDPSKVDATPELKKELVNLLKKTRDPWVKNKTCSDFLNY
ncbi:MAG: sulfatase-like hydrolase/transferase [Bacteroidaceae bacterium]